ncbi:hypothetical protein [Actinomadura kijaniata]|uniref:hypothetical protein n=1 Tax=Actinomadura kijaniata TaxID=46161 RepID=UPI0008379AF0|nr:hypothetical protein [Actinomadura kijaniata]
MSGPGDYGINIHGDVSGGQQAAGQHFSQVQNVGAAAVPDEVAAALDRIERLLGEHAEQLGADEADKARRNVRSIRQELEQDDPDTEAVEGTMGVLGRRIAGVTVLVEAYNQLTALLGLGG